MQFRTNCPPALRGVVLALAVIAGAAPDGAQPRMPTVRIARAESREVEPTVTLVATIEPNRRSILGAEVAGIVSEMKVREGDRVAEGQVLCALRNTTMRLAVEQEQATLAALQAQLDELVAGTRKEELDRFKAAKSEAEAMAAKWDFEKQRVDRLYEGTTASDKEHRDVYAEYFASRHRLEMAEAAYALAVAGPREEEIARARHAVASQQAVLERAQYLLEHTEVRAPFAGTIVRRFVEVGQWVDAGGSVAELIELDTVLVRVNVPEWAIAYVDVDENVRVFVDGLRKTFQGSVRHIVMQADLSARTFPVEAEIDNPQWELRAGMSARVTMVGGERRPGIVVPKDAVVERDGVKYVSIVMSGAQGLTAMPTPVTIGAEVDAFVAITSENVPVGTPVVVRGNEGILFPMPVAAENPQELQTGGPPAADQKQSP